MSEHQASRKGTVSRREFDAVLVSKMLHAIKSEKDYWPDVVHWEETADSIVIRLEFQPRRTRSGR